MTPEVESRRNKWSPAVLAKLNELSELISQEQYGQEGPCLLYTSPSPRDLSTSRMPSSA